MRIAVLGTGMVGQAVAGKLAELGHDVVVGTRDPEATLARTEPDFLGNPPFRAWKQANPAVALATPAAAAAHAELVVNASNGAGSIAMLDSAGEDNLSGNVLIDIAVPLDFSQGTPPSLFVSNTDSLGEQIQRRFPRSRVVKTLNTINCDVMVNPGKVPGDHDVFVCGDDADAKHQVRELLQNFGWPAEHIVDLGDITSARGTEMYVALWLRLWAALGTSHFNIAVMHGQA